MAKKKTTRKRAKKPVKTKVKPDLIVHVSCSGVPRFFSCASSAVVIDTPFNMPNEAASSGDAVHDGCVDLVHDRPFDVDELAEKYSLEDKTDLRVCMAYARQAWEASKQHFPNPKTEQYIKSDLVNGTADVLHHDGETAAVGDWKSGRIPSHATEQLASYAYCLREKLGMPRSGYITAIAWWLRFQEMDVRKMDDAYLDAFADTFKLQLKSAGRQFAPSYDNCGFCLRQNECKARQEYINAAGQAVLVHEAEASAGELTAEQLGELYPQAKLLEKALKAYNDALKQAASRGQVRIGDNKVYRLNEYRKDVIRDVQGAWKHLVNQQGFTPEDMAKVCKLNLTTIKQIAADRADHGDKAKAKARIAKEMADDGCISSIPYTKAAIMKG